MYDTIIIGGGPAAVAAGVYAARKKMKTLFVADQIGGQSVVSNEIENWIGEVKIAGFMLAKKLREHIENYKNEIDIKFPARAEKIEKNPDGTFQVKIGEEVFQTKTVVFCAGGRHRKLDVKGEQEFIGKGVAYCATCDAPFFRDQAVAVVGSGNSGLEAVVDLLKYVKKVYLIVRKDTKEVRGDQMTLEEILNDERVEVIDHSVVQEIYGEKMMTGFKLKNLKTDLEKDVEANGLFVEIGSVPNSELVKDLVDLNDWGNVKVDFRTQATSCAGIFSAGDVTDCPFQQNNIAVGDGTKALLSAYDYVRKN